MEQKSFYSGRKVQSPPKSIIAIPAIPAPLEYSPALPIPQKMLHSIYCSSHLCLDYVDPYLYQSLSKHLMLCELWVFLILQLKNTGWCKNKLETNFYRHLCLLTDSQGELQLKVTGDQNVGPYH